MLLRRRALPGEGKTEKMGRALPLPRLDAGRPAHAGDWAASPASACLHRRTQGLSLGAGGFAVAAPRTPKTTRAREWRRRDPPAGRQARRHGAIRRPAAHVYVAHQCPGCAWHDGLPRFTTVPSEGGAASRPRFVEPGRLKTIDANPTRKVAPERAGRAAAGRLWLSPSTEARSVRCGRRRVCW